jgi:hypothetical protein
MIVVVEGRAKPFYLTKMFLAFLSLFETVSIFEELNNFLESSLAHCALLCSFEILFKTIKYSSFPFIFVWKNIFSYVFNIYSIIKAPIFRPPDLPPTAYPSLSQQIKG